jgi:hypothetical protein
MQQKCKPYKKNKMKKTITTVFVTLGYLTTSFTVQAQKAKYYKEASNISATAAQPSAGSVTILAAMNPQSSKLTKITGTIKNETDFPIDFSQDLNGQIRSELMAIKVLDRPYLPTDPNIIITERYELYNGDNIKNGNYQVSYLIQKINEKEFKYTIYNMPVNQQYIIALTLKNKTTADNLGNNLSVDGALSESYISQLKNNLFNGASMRTTANAGSTITQNITFRNIAVVN